jgi:hypothetical protein
VLCPRVPTDKESLTRTLDLYISLSLHIDQSYNLVRIPMGNLWNSRLWAVKADWSTSGAEWRRMSELELHEMFETFPHPPCSTHLSLVKTSPIIITY